MTFIPTWVKRRVEVNPLLSKGWRSYPYMDARDLVRPEGVGRIKVNLEEKVEMAWLLEAQAYIEWRRLINTIEFAVDVNVEWLDYEVFRQQMGLPIHEDQTLVKNDQYINFATYSVAWV